MAASPLHTFIPTLHAASADFGHVHVQLELGDEVAVLIVRLFQGIQLEARNIHQLSKLCGVTPTTRSDATTRAYHEHSPLTHRAVFAHTRHLKIGRILRAQVDAPHAFQTHTRWLVHALLAKHAEVGVVLRCVLLKLCLLLPQVVYKVRFVTHDGRRGCFLRRPGRRHFLADVRGQALCVEVR